MSLKSYIVKLENKVQTLFVPGYGYRELVHMKNYVEDEFILAVMKYFPHIVFEGQVVDEKVGDLLGDEKVLKTELLNEAPVDIAKVETKDAKSIDTVDNPSAVKVTKNSTEAPEKKDTAKDSKTKSSK